MPGRPSGPSRGRAAEQPASGAPAQSPPLPGASYGNVTTVTDPDLGLNVQQVQYVNQPKASVTQRISLIYGVALGQVNAGQLIKSA